MISLEVNGKAVQLEGPTPLLAYIEQLGVNPEQVTPQASFIEDLGADSLDIVELVMAFEEEFSVEVPDEDAEKLQTVGDVINYIKERAKSTGGESGGTAGGGS